MIFRRNKTKFDNHGISFLRIFRAPRWRITRRGCGNFLDRWFVARSVTVTAEYSRSTCTSILWREVGWGMSAWYTYTVSTGGRSISFPLANEVIYIQKLIRPKVANLDESLLCLSLPSPLLLPRTRTTSSKYFKGSWHSGLWVVLGERCLKLERPSA